MDGAFARSTDDVLQHFQVSPERGLSEAQVKASLEKHGRNGTHQPSASMRSVGRVILYLC